MIAVDTNVLVRLLTVDDARRAAAAKALFAAGPVWIAKTVLIESVKVEDQAAVAAALALSARGLEFADALHLSSRPAGSKFFSLHCAFIRRARRAGAEGASEVEPAVRRT